MLLSFTLKGESVAKSFNDLDAVAANPGEFAGTALTDSLAFGTAGGEIKVPVRWISKVTLKAEGSVRFILTLPSPLPGYPQPGVKNFDIALTYERAAPRWTVNVLSLNWFDNDAHLQGNLGEWLPGILGSHALSMKKPFPLFELGICTGQINSSHFKTACLALLPYDSGLSGSRALALAMVPVNTSAWNNQQPSFKSVALARLEKLEITALEGQDAESREQPAILLAPLPPASPAKWIDSPWVTIVQWRIRRPSAADEPDPSRINARRFFERIWNRSVQYTMVGSRSAAAGEPWWPLPTFSAGPEEYDSRPLLFFATPGPTAAETRLVDIKFRGPNVGVYPPLHNVVTHFQWTAAESIPTLLPDEKDPDDRGAPDVGGILPATTLDLTCGCEVVTVSGWGDGKADPATSPIDIPSAAQLALLAEVRPDRTDPEHVASWKMVARSATPQSGSKWLSLGSVEIQILPISSHDPLKLDCTLRGTWNRSNCDLYPEFKITGIPCLMRLSNTGDPGQEELRAAFDVANRLEDELQRPTRPIVGTSLSQPEGGIEGNLTIRVKADRGRNALVELRLKRDLDQTTQPLGKLYVQARPFNFAKLSPPVFDPEGGDDFAIWRNDDAEGAQWRLPEARIEFDLPPQTVAEEMERGSRFWPGGKKYIIADSPLKYRFSPPAHLALRPGQTERRYNSNPNNLSAVLDGARVEAFRTELLYPLQVGFEVDANGEPAIDIGETGSFVGRPSPNLPISPDESLTNDLIREVLPDDLAQWLVDLGKATPAELKTFIDQYDSLRWSQSANRAQFVARVAQFHLSDPAHPGGQIALTRGLTAGLRQPLLPDAHGQYPVGSMPPLLNPLADGSDLTPEQKNDPQAARFLKNGLWAPDAGDGALRAGALHTVEFASELSAILREPRGVSAFIDRLAFSVLGATGASGVSFDEGRTTFSAEVADGQVWRIRKIRIGRIAIFWNRAKHVIVYERAVIPSEQFEGQQPDLNTLAWPILRKTEEYVEPLEPLRVFDKEPDATQNSTAFANALEFITPRVYVDGAWGHDCIVDGTMHGYEIPLWNPADRSGFYPKPLIAVVAHAGGGETSRAWHQNPQELYFYTNTEAGMGSDSDSWAPKPFVDAPGVGPARLPILMAANLGSEQVLDASSVPNPRLGGARRLRFDLPVHSDGPVNVQHGRGNTEMLAAGVAVVSFARTAAISAAPSDSPISDVGALMTASSTVAGLNDQVQALLQSLPSIWLRYQFDCDRLCIYLQDQVDRLFQKVKDQADAAFSVNLPGLNADPAALGARLRQELLDKVLPPTDGFRSLSDSFNTTLTQIQALTDKELDDRAKDLHATMDALRQSADAFLFAGEQKVRDALLAPVNLARKSLEDLSSALNSLFQGVQGLKSATTAQDIKAAAQKIDDISADIGQRVKSIHVPQLDSVLGKIASLASLGHQLASATLQFQIDTDLKDFKNKVLAALDPAAKAIGDLQQAFDALVKSIQTNVFDKVCDPIHRLQKSVGDIIDNGANWVAGKVRGTIHDLATCLYRGVGQAESQLDQTYLTWRSEIQTQLGSGIQQLSQVLASMAAPAVALAVAAQQAAASIAKGVSVALNKYQSYINGLIRDFKNSGCGGLQKFQADILSSLKAAADHISQDITEAATTLIDAATSDKMMALASKADAVGKGLKLMKAIGSLPALPHLTFNADRVEYLFEDLKKEISTSPFAAKLAEIDSGLKELGLAIPVRKFLDQMIPDSLEVDFNKVFRDFGGIDFRRLFSKFRLPELRSDQIQITHGVDQASRSAWAKATVAADYPAPQELFALGPLVLQMSGLSLRAQSDMRIGLDGSRTNATSGNLRATWMLQFQGAPLVQFRDVTVTLDGGNFHVNVAPENIELHPALKFVSDIAKQLGESIPPCIEVVHDQRGLIVGARANLSTIIETPPPSPPVLIGPLTLIGGLGLTLENGAGFVVNAHMSVGSKTAPIFVQIGYLGGGMWLETEASCIEGTVHYSASVGLALGTSQAFNIAGIARGSFALLLFANASIADQAGGSIHAGLSIQGTARILGIVSAYVLILLEVVHEQGSSRGTGTLDVEVEIGRFFTVSVHKEVEHSL
jgi:hypothetical protein